MKKEPTEPVQFQNTFDAITPYDLDNILEYLKDNLYLSEKGERFKTEFWEMFIKKDTEIINEQALRLEDHNFRVNSNKWKKITVEDEKYLVNSKGDIWEILERNCKGAQLFTWDAATRETKKAGKRMPTDDEFTELLKTKKDMSNIVYSNYRYINGSFSSRGTGAKFWSSTQSGTTAWARGLYSSSSTVSRDTFSKAGGFSVRCIKE